MMLVFLWKKRRHKTCPTPSLALMCYVPRLPCININTFWTREALIQWSTMYDNWKSSLLPRSGEKLPSNPSCNATVDQHKLPPPPTLDTSIAAAEQNSTSGATICYEIPSTFAGAARCPEPAMHYKEVMLVTCLWRDYVPAGETYVLGSHFAPRSYLTSVAESNSMK